jgi:small GTP-binding protein
MKRLVCGIIAHVDAGKTTLAEALLYTAGKIRSVGRVDHRSTYFDTHDIERDRGITIFSKQAEIEYAGCSITLMDTPGHVNFSAETERVLSVLDCAVLVISGAEGVQAHTETLWQLLERYHIPTFIFISKNDLSTFDRESVISSLASRLDSGCVDVISKGADEQIAMCDEAVLEKYMESGSVSDEDVRELVAGRKLFPCYVGSGLKLVGVERFLADLVKFAPEREYPTTFSARVYKIGHDKGGARETFLKITGGELSVRETVK